MKKYSSYVDLKLGPSQYYNPKISAVGSPTYAYGSTSNINTSKVSCNKITSTPKSPSFKKAIMYDSPVMMISK